MQTSETAKNLIIGQNAASQSKAACSLDVKTTEMLARLVAIYLPQFHPIPENDEWWGKGFTEWTNVTKAKSHFPGHYQPHLPADLGFYDLRLPEVRIAQAEMARQYGIQGFCYYHYWFNGRRMLERPFNEVLSSGEPDFPFCLCWANENWTRTWDGQEKQVLLEQKYNSQDDIDHIQSLMPAFADPRYLRVEGKPLFIVYSASRLPEPHATTDRWRQEAYKAGIGELLLCRVESGHEMPCGDPHTLGFDAALSFEPSAPHAGNYLFRDPYLWSRKSRVSRYIKKAARGDFSALPQIPQDRYCIENNVFDYNNLVELALAEEEPSYPRIPCVSPSWDNSARRKSGGTIFINSSPDKYKYWLAETIQKATAATSSRVSTTESPLVFINAWNEWAEGNHLEPCQKWGRAYLEATQQALRQSLPAT